LIQLRGLAAGQDVATFDQAAQSGQNVLKIVPTLAKEEEDSDQALVAQARKTLAAYVERVVKR
jgi:hypothetical protein